MKSILRLIPQQRIGLFVLFIAAAFLLFGFASTATAKGVTIEDAKISELQGGTYSVFGYGCNASEDTPAIAILKREGTPYDFTMDAPVAEYRVSSGLAVGDAVRLAEKFVQCNPEAQDVEFNRIVAPDGTVLGYEMTPIYSPLRYGSAGLIGTSYRIEENMVFADVEVNPLTELNDWGGG